jgi:citrate synthase
MTEHFDVKAEAREQYQRSKEQMQQLVEKSVSDIEMLDDIAYGSYELNRAARAWLQELVRERNRKIPKALVDLISTTAAEVRQHLKAKQDLLGENPADDIADVLRTLWGEDNADNETEEASG